MFLIVNDALSYVDLNPEISLDLTLFLYGFSALFLLNSYILLEVYKIKRYIKKRGEK
jgi:hypothetical protein